MLINVSATGSPGNITVHMIVTVAQSSFLSDGSNDIALDKMGMSSELNQ